MNKTLLVTQSLYGAMDFYESSGPKWKERARQSLTNTVTRTYDDEMPFAVQRGIDFENDVYSILNTGIDINTIKCSDIFRSILKACEGGKFQSKVTFYIDVDGVTYCLYGKIDVEYPDKIIDIKTKGKWDGYSANNLLSSIQHNMYCYGKRIKTFEYHCAIFDDKSDSPKPVAYHTVPYNVNTFDEEHEIICNAIRRLRDFMQRNPVWDKAWREIYTKY